jgi:hypothetical protein
LEVDQTSEFRSWVFEGCGLLEVCLDKELINGRKGDEGVSLLHSLSINLKNKQSVPVSHCFLLMHLLLFPVQHS